MDWMYNKLKVDPEEFLLGKPIDKSFFKEPSPTNFMQSIKDEPKAALSQMELSRRKKEDPLTIIKEKEFEKTKLLYQKSQLKKDSQTVPVFFTPDLECSDSKSIHQLTFENLRQLPFNIDLEKMYHRLKEKKEEKKRKRKEDNSNSDKNASGTRNDHNRMKTSLNSRKSSRSSHRGDNRQKYRRTDEKDRRRPHSPCTDHKIRRNDDFRRNTFPDRESDNKNVGDKCIKRSSKENIQLGDSTCDSRDRLKRSRSKSVDTNKKRMDDRRRSPKYNQRRSLNEDRRKQSPNDDRRRRSPNEDRCKKSQNDDRRRKSPNEDRRQSIKSRTCDQDRGIRLRKNENRSRSKRYYK